MIVLLRLIYQKDSIYFIINNTLIRKHYSYICEQYNFIMSKKTFTEEQVNIARIAKALSHPVRIAILQMLATHACCYHGDMSEIIPVAKSTLSQHLKELRDAGLIQGEITLPSIKYCINQKNWEIAKCLFGDFFKDIKVSSESC